ncbi:ankyrin repeat-containing domain protein [Pavlovales sp. CCMP2436]|nr:ankyrin repeat-containing domain protein [Pavlovales sp. CCMP2436]
MAQRLAPIRIDQLLATAVHRGDGAKVREHLAHGAVANAANEYGMMPLHFAAEQGHADVALALLKHGASTRAANARGETALHMAAREGDAELAEILLAYGASATQTDRSGRSPLDLANELDDAVDRYDILQSRSWRICVCTAW